MSAGTLTLTNNSAAVNGNGTAFNNELVAGDFIVATVGGVTYTLPVKTIETGTALTLARNYNGPTVSAGAWTAMPRDTLNRISAQIAADTAYAIRQRVLEIDNWYQLLEVNGDVTIKMADGSSYTGPSWLSVISQTRNLSALGIGGTGISLTALDWQTFDFVPGAKFNVSSLNITNTPPGLTIPSGSYGVLINVTGYEGNNRHVEVWISTTTAANYYHYEIRVTNNNQPGQRAFTVRQIWTSADVIPLANTALSTIGIGGYSTSISNFDWQTATFEQGSNVNVNCSNWLNAPPGLPTASIGLIEVVAVHNQEGANRRYVLRVSQIVQGSTRQMWDIVGYGASGSRTWTVDSYLIFSSAADGRQKLGFNDLGIGGQIGAQAAFDWQTFAFETSAHYNVSADSWVGAPSELSSVAGNVAVVVVASTGSQNVSSAWNMLELTTYNNSSARKIFSVVCRGAIGSRTFSVTPLLAKADLDARVGYALLAPAGNITTSQRVVLGNPFGINVPVICYIEISFNSAWMTPGMIYSPSYGTLGITASYKGGEGIIVQAGNYRIGSDPLSGGTNGGAAGTGLNNTTTAPYRVHVFKVTA